MARCPKEDTRMISYKGKTQSLYQWSKDTGIPYKCLFNRLKKHWTIERALTELPNPKYTGRVAKPSPKPKVPKPKNVMPDLDLPDGMRQMDHEPLPWDLL